VGGAAATVTAWPRSAFAPPGEDAIDGVKVDTAGNVYACGPRGIWVLSPEGRRLAVLGLPEDPHNLAWGEDDHTLYVTALTSVYRLRLKGAGR
jgi:gluconolactonase